MAEEGRSTTTTLWLATVLMAASQIQLSIQLPWNHPMRGVVDRINRRNGPFIGLVMTFGTEEAVLLQSGHLTTTATLQFNGRTFYVGTVKDVPVVAVMTGEQIANAAMTVQMLYDNFDVTGVVHYGIAGAGNSSLAIGDVVIPNYVAYSNSWHWINNGSSIGDNSSMTFGEFNLPEPGSNWLGSIEFNTVEVYTTNSSSSSGITSSEERVLEKEFYIATDEAWYNISLQLTDFELNQCLTNYSGSTGSVCTTAQPVPQYGQIVATSNVFVANQAFRDFCFNKFNFSVSDEETAAVVQTSISNRKPCVVFRGISDMGGGSTTTSTTTNVVTLETLAAYNSMEMAVAFIGLYGGTDSAHPNIIKPKNISLAGQLAAS